MDIHDLKIFLTIAQEGSVSKASKLLYMTPQGTSKVLKNLETEMGCQLFIRDKSGMKLTESGERFREYALKDVDDYYQVKKDILHIEQRQKKVVDLLSAYGILRLLTPDCLVAFREKYPDIEFHYREYPDLPVEQLFAGNEGNVAFSIGDFDEHLYQVVPLETFPIRLLVNEKHPLAQKESVTIEDLQGEPMFIESSQFHIYHLITERCEEAGFEPDIIFQTDTSISRSTVSRANTDIPRSNAILIPASRSIPLRSSSMRRYSLAERLLLSTSVVRSAI